MRSGEPTRGGSQRAGKWRALVFAVLLAASAASAGKFKKHEGPEKLSLFDSQGDLTTDLWGPSDATLQQQIDQLISARPVFAKALADEQFSMVMVDLTDPSRLATAAVRPDWETFPASLGKIAILLGTVDKARASDPSQLIKLKPSMDRMIKASSNEDASALFTWTGHESIVASVARHKLYDEKTGGLWWTPSAPFPKSPKEKLRISATARQVARYFLMMEQGKLVSPDDSRFIKAVFHNAGLALFSKGIQKRFGDTDYYGKPGILEKEIAEGMLIEAPGARYIVAIVMKGLGKDAPEFQELGQSLHALILERNKSNKSKSGGNWSLELDAKGMLALARPDGSVALPLKPLVRVTREGVAEDASEAKWTRTDAGVFKTTLTTRGSKWELEATPSGMNAALTWTADGSVDAASLEFPHTAKTARMLDAAYRQRAAPVRTGTFSPQVAWLDDVTLVGHAQGLTVTKDTLTLDAEVSGAHPFRSWSECVVEPTGKPIVTRPPLLEQSARVVKAGERTSLSLQFFPQTPWVPVVLRYPNGFRGAFVLTDHGDQVSSTRLGALMYGKATFKDALVGRGGKKGFANHGLTLTKVVFAYTTEGYARQLDEDPKVAELYDALVKDGIELGSHSASGDPDSVERTTSGLQQLAKWSPSTWIDHQPTTNCEALTNKGRDETLKILAAQNFRYAWSGEETRAGKELNLFQPSSMKPVSSVLYQHPLTGSLWLFPSRWMALPKEEFFERLSAKSLEKLETERGLVIAHTYLDIFIEGSATRLDQWSLLEKIPNGYALTAEADEAFERLAKHQKQGKLWVTTLRSLGDFMRDVDQLTWRIEGSTVILTSAKAIKGVSLLKEDGTVEVVDVVEGETRIRW
ncbi:MAG: hypothetical protein JNM17_39040 [Archangium sp.]|nr:hypothetical protein [Archangium sp.]